MPANKNAAKGKTYDKNESMSEKMTLEQMAEKHFKVQHTGKEANTVDFTAIFQEGLPPKAEELIKDIRELLTNKEKASKDDEIAKKAKSAERKLKVAKEIFTDDKTVSAKMMASELLYDHFKLNQY